MFFSFPTTFINLSGFPACLDRDNAKIITFNLQKIARQQGKTVITVTTTSDLLGDLKPNVAARRFGIEIQVNYYQNEIACYYEKAMLII